MELTTSANRPTAVVTYPIFDPSSILDDLEVEVLDASILQIRSQKDYEYAVDLLNKFSGFGAKCETLRKEAVAPLNEVRNNIQAAFNPIKDKIDVAVRDLKSKIAVYSQEQERKAREEQRRLEELARIEREKAEEALRAAELEAQTLQQMPESTAAEIEEASEKVEASQIKVAEAVAPVVVAETKKTKGASVSTKLQARIVNLKMFLNFVADHPEFSEWIKVNESKVNAYVKATNGQIKVPGVSVEQVATVRATRRYVAA